MRKQSDLPNMTRLTFLMLISLVLTSCVPFTSAAPNVQTSLPINARMLVPTQTQTPIPPQPTPTQPRESSQVTKTLTKAPPVSTTEPTFQVVDELWNWQQVGPWDRQDGFIYNGKDLVWTEGWNKQGEPPGQNFTGTKLLTQRNGRQSLWLTTEGTYLNTLTLDQGYLVVTEAQTFGPIQQIYLINLNTGERKLFDQREGKFDAPDYHIPLRIVLNGGRLIWNSARPDRHSCLRMFTWETLTTQVLFCSEQPEEILQPFNLEGNTLLYGVLHFMPFRAEVFQQNLPEAKGERPEARPLFRIDRDAEYLATDGQVTALLGPYLQSVMAKDLYAGSMDGTLQRLDYTDNNMNACYGYVFWANNPRGEVRAWKPGSPIQVVFRGGSNFSFACADGWVAFNHIGSENPDENGIYAIKVP